MATIDIPIVTFEHLNDRAQTVIYNILKFYLSENTINRIKGRATIEVYKKKDFPVIEIEYPTIERSTRRKVDYNQKELILNFKINVYSIKDDESITLADLVNYTLDSKRSDMHTGLLGKYNLERIEHTFKWDKKIEKKYYKSIIEFNVVWSGS